MAGIILHHFAASPFAERIRLIFGLKGLSWQGVDAELVMPKPKLTALTGGYRKTPVMQIGNDIYCDSRLIALELERRYPNPTVFPYNSRASCMALSAWTDCDFHMTTSALAIGVNKHLMPQSLVDDRRSFFGNTLDVDGLENDIPHLRTQLRAHLDIVDQHFSDGRHFWFGDQPSMADFQVYTSVWTVRTNLPFAESELSPFPHVVSWETRMKRFGWGTTSEITAEDAIKLAQVCTSTPVFDVDGADALGLLPGAPVVVTPTDYGCEPVEGQLVKLTVTEVAIERHDPDAGTLTVHFPRIGFRVSATSH
ncbi:Glutathione S-transferase, domain-containing protein [Cladophialophora immunda]|nr:Glutathione S-transferase, domain-containing protein [Cladophialophora immunda]